MNKLFSSLVFLVLTMSLSASLPAMAYVDDELDADTPISKEQANAKVTELLNNTKIVGKEFFCEKGILSCRVHYSLTDMNNKPIRAMYTRFVAADRSVASQGYFFPVKGQPNKFLRFEDFTFDGKVNVDVVEQKNLVTIQKDSSNHLKAMLGIITPRLGTTKYIKGDILVYLQGTILQGALKDFNDPNFNEPIKIIYYRNIF